MSDEVREMLDSTNFQFKDVDENDNEIIMTLSEAMESLNNELDERQTNLLLDYITNLQEENEQLKEELENNIDRYEDTISYQLGFDKGKDYIQQRIDKAINYILENICCDTRVYTKSENVYKVIDILRGDE